MNHFRHAAGVKRAKGDGNRANFGYSLPYLLLFFRRSTMKTTKRVTVLSALALVAISGLLFAGPLDPPAGPVASTYKTLTEVEPRIAINATNTPGDATSSFRITQPGSYYLTGNITGELGKAGIRIEASHVTIDLSGYVMDGATVPGVAGSRDGIVSSISLSNIRVTNGVIKSWGRRGILLTGASSSMYDRLRLSGNGANLISQALYVGSSSIITDCVLENNIGQAINAGSSCVITRCSINGGMGEGIITGSGCRISECTVVGIAANGIVGGTGCTIRGCMASGNTGSGIVGGAVNAISGCTASGNSGSGIFAGNGSTISGCTAASNTGNGIDALSGCTISGCTTGANTLDGIRVADSCLVLSNTSSNNGSGAGDGAGIHATGSDNRIEGNACISSDRGFDVDAPGNIIIRNTCTNTGWDIVANNIYGPIIDRRIPAPVAGTPAVTGTAAASTLGSTDPNANFTY